MFGLKCGWITESCLEKSWKNITRRMLPEFFAPCALALASLTASRDDGVQLSVGARRNQTPDLGQYAIDYAIMPAVLADLAKEASGY